MNKKIRVTFVVTNCKRTGPINQTFNIIRHMDRSKFEPSLITIFKEDEFNTMIDSYRNLNIDIYCAGLSKAKSILYGQKIITKLLSDIKPDIVQGVGMPPYRMTLKYKSTIHFLTLRNYCYEDYPDQYGKFIGRPLAFLDMQKIHKQIKKGSPFVTCSNSLTKLYNEKQNIKINYIRNGVDTSKFCKRTMSTNAHFKKILKLPMNKKVFVYSGRMIDRKNQKEAIEGFLNSDISKISILLLLGDGNNLESLTNEYKSYSNIIFKGNVSNISDYLHASDYYISSSKSEGLPNGVLEAMSIGLPVLLSDIPQHIEFFEIDSNIGDTYKLGNIDDLKKKFNEIIKKDWLILSDAAYKVVINNLTSEMMSRNYQNLYENLVKSNNKLSVE